MDTRAIAQPSRGRRGKEGSAAASRARPPACAGRGHARRSTLPAAALPSRNRCALARGDRYASPRHAQNGNATSASSMGDVTDIPRPPLQHTRRGCGSRCRPFDRIRHADRRGRVALLVLHDDRRPFALEIKSLESALRVRQQILTACEAAEIEQDPERRKAWRTFVVGGGASGVEIARRIADPHTTRSPANSAPPIRAARTSCSSKPQNVCCRPSRHSSRDKRNSRSSTSASPCRSAPRSQTSTDSQPGPPGPRDIRNRIPTRTIPCAAGSSDANLRAS
jgi:hypothetical protein